MSKISRGHYNTFQENILVARGFVKIQFYLEDLLKTGGKASVGVLQSFANELMEAAGLGKGGLETLARERLGPDIDAKLKSLDKRVIQKQVDAFLRKNRARLQSMVNTIHAANLALERGLTLQAIVVASSAFEAYVEDTIVEAIASNSYIRTRFQNDAERNLSFHDIKSSDFDAYLAIGRASLRAYDTADANRVRALLEKCIGNKVTTLEGGGASTYRRLLAYRNLVAHRAGIVDEPFRRATGYKGALGQPVVLSREFVESALTFFDELGTEVQIKLEAQKAPAPKSKQP